MNLHNLDRKSEIFYNSHDPITIFFVSEDPCDWTLGITCDNLKEAQKTQSNFKTQKKSAFIFEIYFISYEGERVPKIIAVHTERGRQVILGQDLE